MKEFIITARQKATNEETDIAICTEKVWADLIRNTMNFGLGNMYEFSVREK